MSATSDPTPDRRSDGPSDRFPHGPADRTPGKRRDGDRPLQPWVQRTDLDVLTGEPSLASLRWHGWQLDGLPTTSVGWAFAGALGTTSLAYGTLGAALVIIGIVVTLLLAGSAVLMRDVPAARVTLKLARVGLLACLLVSTAHL
jgi:hypothetical protein